MMDFSDDCDTLTFFEQAGEYTMSGNGKYNGNGHDPDHKPDEDNIVKWPTLAERQRMQREEQEAERRAMKQTMHKEPLINMPPMTKWGLLTLVLIHLVTAYALSPEMRYWTFMHFGFVPGRYTGMLEFGWQGLVGPFSYMLLHGGWLHLGINTVMLMAFGTGVEKWMGGRRMLGFFVTCGLIAVATHFIFNPGSLNPVVGASGGLSGLFAAVLIMLGRMRERSGMGRQSLLPFIILWIGIMILFGMMGGPDGSNIAWAAHLGGFLGGFVVLRLMRII